MHIAFVYGKNSVLRPEEGTERASGGIATALLALSASLSRRGHEIDVFSFCESPGTHGGVRFHARGDFAGFAEVSRPDVLVVLPDGLPFLFPIRTRARVLWTGNAFSAGDVALSANWHWAPQLGKAGRTAR